MGGDSYHIFETAVFNPEGETIEYNCVARSTDRGYEFDEEYSMANKLRACMDAKPTIIESARDYLSVSRNLAKQDIRLINSKAQELLIKSRKLIENSKIRHR